MALAFILSCLMQATTTTRLIVAGERAYVSCRCTYVTCLAGLNCWGNQFLRACTYKLWKVGRRLQRQTWIILKVGRRLQGQTCEFICQKVHFFLPFHWQFGPCLQSACTILFW
jgi:hypothetical protein